MIRIDTTESNSVKVGNEKYPLNGFLVASAYESDMVDIIERITRRAIVKGVIYSSFIDASTSLPLGANQATTITALNNAFDASGLTGIDVDNLDDVTLTSLANNQVLAYNSTLAKWVNVDQSGYLNNFDSTASTMASTLDAGTATIERIDTARWTGTGVYLNQQSDTPSSGNVIQRKVYYKDEFGSTDAFGTWALIHEFADDTSYADALTYINDTIIAGQTNGIAPASLVMTWEDASGFSGLLNDYPGAAAAYSLRLLDGSYTGSAIRVRRASDNAEQDIGFDNNELDTSALDTFCSGTNGFVKTWYSQTGSHDTTQTATINQPKIYDSVTGVVTQNGKPAVDFDGSNDFLDSTGLSETILTSFHVAKPDQTNSGAALLCWDGITGSSFFRYNSSANMRVNHNGGFNSTTTYTAAQNLVFALFSTSPKLGYNGATAETGSATGKTTTGVRIGQKGNTDYFNGKAQEIVVWPSDKSADRSGIETNINDFYSIY